MYAKFPNIDIPYSRDGADFSTNIIRVYGIGLGRRKPMRRRPLNIPNNTVQYCCKSCTLSRQLRRLRLQGTRVRLFISISMVLANAIFLPKNVKLLTGFNRELTSMDRLTFARTGGDTL